MNALAWLVEQVDTMTPSQGFCTGLAIIIVAILVKQMVQLTWDDFTDPGERLGGDPR